MNGISHTLSKLPQELNLRACDNRTVSSMGDVLGFLERCRGYDNFDDANIKEKVKEKEREWGEDKGLGKMKQKISFNDVSDDSYSDFSRTYDFDDDVYNIQKLKNEKKTVKTKIPVGVTLLQSLFADAINERKFKQAARIIRLLEGSRLVIDIDASALAISIGNNIKTTNSAVQNINDNNINNNNNNDKIDNNSNYYNDKYRNKKNDNNNQNESSTVKIVRETLARRWAALLIASSLKKLKSNVAGSMKLVAALKYLQSEKLKENEIVENYEKVNEIQDDHRNENEVENENINENEITQIIEKENGKGVKLEIELEY